MKKLHFRPILILALTYLVVMIALGCQSLESVDLSKTPLIRTVEPTPTLTRPPTATELPTILPSHTATFTPQPSPTYDQPLGCQEPQGDYSLLEINGMLINQRTYNMLTYAQSLYGGELELTGYHLTQGSYTNDVSASFGTHSGGGAVDLSVIQYGTYKVLYDDIQPLILALRTAGFAAWLRDFDELYPGSPIHIHAIAIGDKDLPAAAINQLIGDFGYFRGYNGLPQAEGANPIADGHGGPIICLWMLEQGYSDLRTSIP
jgi:hypothetical protein